MGSPIFAAVYAIRNTVNDKCYVGSSVNLARRWLVHRSNLKCGTHPNPLLLNAYRKHGPEAFEYVILEEVTDLNAILDREQWWIDSLRPAYNLRPTAGNNYGWVPSEETLARRRAAMKLLWQDPVQRAIWLERAVPAGAAAVRGIPLTPERRAQVSATTRAAYANNPQVRQNLIDAMTGKPRTPEAREHIAAASVIRWQDEDYRRKFRAARKEDRSSDGEYHLDEAARSKISASKTGQPRPDVAAKNADPEYQARCKAVREAYWARKAAERAAAGLKTRSKFKPD